MPGVIFIVNTYKCFMENKNMVRTFCGCKSSKTTLILIKILLFFCFNLEALNVIQETKNMKSKMTNKFW